MKDSHFRHSKANQPPLPVKAGLMIHSQTRKKSTVNDLVAAGFSVTHKRIQEIQDSIGQQLLEKYDRKKIVCPYTLKPDLFTFGATDNVDHNPTSSTATSSFHGTSVSIFQYLENKDEMVKVPFTLEKSQKKTAIKLPDYYTDIEPTNNGKPEPPQVTLVALSSSNISHGDFEWLNNVNLLSDDDSNERYSFSSFHS